LFSMALGRIHLNIVKTPLSESTDQRFAASRTEILVIFERDSFDASPRLNIGTGHYLNFRSLNVDLQKIDRFGPRHLQSALKRHRLHYIRVFGRFAFIQQSPFNRMRMPGQGGPSIAPRNRVRMDGNEFAKSIGFDVCAKAFQRRPSRFEAMNGNSFCARLKEKSEPSDIGANVNYSLIAAGL
jgi:hypothetical protein